MRHGNVRIAQRSPWSFVAAPLFADGRNLDRTDEPSAKPDRRTQSNGVITVDSDRSLHHGPVSGDQMLGNVGDGTRKVPTFLVNALADIGVRSPHVGRQRIHPLACISLRMTVSEPQTLEAGTVRAKRARAAGMSPAARALRSDVVRRAASRGGTLRCAEARRVAYHNVDKSYAPHRPG
jgi:hypothetical protein